MMDRAIRDFPKQFAWQPEVANKEKLHAAGEVIVAGMGGSNLAADLLMMRHSELSLTVYKDYGLPPHKEYGMPPQSDELPNLDLETTFARTLLIASSYSGNTEEALSAYAAARERGMQVAAVAAGGTLLEYAKRDRTPYVQMPETGIQPRMALGFNLRALLALLGDEDGLRETETLSVLLHPASAEQEGKALAEALHGFVPVVYSSMANLPIAYNWKIKFNETGKVPAFSNVFPELNHNEMTGFDWVKKNKALSRQFHFIFLEDKEDSQNIRKRMKICRKLYEDRGLAVTVSALKGNSLFHKVFSSLLLADWAAYHTALLYAAEPEQVPLVEEFKKLMRE